MVKIKETGERKDSVSEIIKNFIYRINLFKFALFLIGLKAIDVLSTYYALLNINEAKELNPILNWMFQYTGVGFALFLAFTIYSIIIYRVYNTKNIKINKHEVYIIIASLMISVDINNIISIF